jgi:hypothetical protein
MLEWPAVWRAHGSFPDAVVVTDWLDFDLVLDALVPGLDDEPHMRHTVSPPRVSPLPLYRSALHLSQARCAAGCRRQVASFFTFLHLKRSRSRILLPPPALSCLLLPPVSSCPSLSHLLWVAVG